MAADKQDKVLNFSSEREQSGACSSSAEREKNQGKNFLNVPTLRFPEFSGEWEKTKLSEVCHIATGNKNTQDKDDNGQYPFYVRSQHIEHINSWTYDGEAILTAGDGVGVGKVFHYSKGKIGIHQRVYILNDFKCDGKFLFYYFSGHFYDRVKRMSAKNSVDSVRMEMIANMNFIYPRRGEQTKIGHLFSLLDERIETQIRIIKDLKSLSDVICERLYNPSEKDSWQTYKYADLFSISNERNSKLQYTNVLSASQEYGMIERNELNIDIKFEASSIKNYKIVRPNQYVIHLRSFQGGFAYSDKTGVCSPAYTILVPNEKISPAFLKYYFTSKKFIDSLRIVTYGIRDGRSISVEEFLQLKAVIPDVAHQQHIVQVMQLWEEKIRTEEKCLSKLQKQKKYLLSSMFI